MFHFTTYFSSGTLYSLREYKVFEEKYEERERVSLHVFPWIRGSWQEGAGISDVLLFLPVADDADAK